MKKNMGQIIKEERIKLGLTQEELGKKLGVQKSIVAKYENGHVENMKRSKIEQLARIFNCSPAYLMGWEDPDPIEQLPTDIEIIARNMEKMNKSDREKIVKIVQMLSMNDIDNTNNSGL